MPAISVRDIEVKDDESCLCSDLVAGTHGRGFWILDDVTPLRQAAEAAAASKAYLFKPATGIRIRFGTNDPTPWPPELPAGENPPAGRHRRLLPAFRAAGEVKLEVPQCRGQGDSHVFEQRSGAEARSGDRSGGLQQALPGRRRPRRIADCRFTGPRPPQILKTSAGHAPLYLGHALRSDPRDAGAAAAGAGPMARFRIAPIRP